MQVPPGAVDANRHANNVEYLRWMQQAAQLHYEASGCAAATLAAGATWVVRAHRIEYLRPAFAGDQLAVWTWVVRFGQASSLRKYQVRRLPDQAVLARAETDWVFVEVRTGRPCALPQAIKEAFVCLPAGQEP